MLSSWRVSYLHHLRGTVMNMQSWIQTHCVYGLTAVSLPRNDAQRHQRSRLYSILLHNTYRSTIIAALSMDGGVQDALEYKYRSIVNPMIHLCVRRRRQPFIFMKSSRTPIPLARPPFHDAASNSSGEHLSCCLQFFIHASREKTMKSQYTTRVAWCYAFIHPGAANSGVL